MDASYKINFVQRNISLPKDIILSIAIKLLNCPSFELGIICNILYWCITYTFITPNTTHNCYCNCNIINRKWL